MKDTNSKNKVTENFPGIKGEAYVELWAKSNDFSYHKGSIDENYKHGIDCFINKIPCDVKNTKYVFFGKYDLDRDSFSVRHPFRDWTEAENYVLLEDDLNGTKVIYFGSINGYLIENYFIDLHSLEEFKRVINHYDFSSFKDYNLNEVDEFSNKLCNFLSKYIKDSVTFDVLKERELQRLGTKHDKHELCFKLVKKEVLDSLMKQRRKIN